MLPPMTTSLLPHFILVSVDDSVTSFLFSFMFVSQIRLRFDTRFEFNIVFYHMLYRNSGLIILSWSFSFKFNE